MQKLVKQGKDSAAIYQGQGRADLAEAELAQVAVLEAYLPKQMSNEELEAALKEIIAEVGAAGPQDMGKSWVSPPKSWQAKPKDVPSRLK